jgi:hypothetical protein
MAGKNQHVVPHGDQWAARGEGNAKVTRLYETQRAAIDDVREIARHQQNEVFLHGQNGRTRERNTYGRDPFPPSG